ncbi:MAG: arsenate reductase ArsC [Acidobacteria bacterium]|nr:arsenate reductase ArsC [Acidobacteriota bacterium]
MMAEVKLPLRVLFVCIGNSCRSQMAEGFARHRHGDVMTPLSAGLYPAAIVQLETIASMAEKELSLEGQQPKSISSIDDQQVDLLINMSGMPIPPSPSFQGGTLVWEVTDPIGRSTQVYREVRDRIESLVSQLAETLRKHAPKQEE